MIKEINNVFYLITDKTEYILRVTEGKLLEHIYYGEKLNSFDITPYTDKLTFVPGNSIEYADGSRKISTEHFKSEISEIGKGDVRIPFIDVIHADGSRTCDFIFDSYSIFQGKYKLNELPSAYTDNIDDCTSLIIKLKDRNSGDILELMYSVFNSSNIITKAARLSNTEKGDIRLRSLMSNQLDFDEFDSYDLISFAGEWANEMNLTRRKVEYGITANASFCGTSSNRSNPFCIICSHDANENYGHAYGFNLIYSGNHYETAYMDAFEKIRFTSGINPQECEFILKPQEQFETPEAVLSFSSNGFTELSHNMHDFINNNIVRGKWKNKERPVLINSWESFYFDISEGKLLSLAKKAADLGTELFVIDDGWFEGRNDDTTSLGDWKTDKKKFPHGLRSFGDKLKKLNMDLGIWVEPEMINEKSELFRKHPEYAVRIPSKDHALGRNQMILNLTMKEVQDYIIDSMSKVFESADITYVKWDMNRIFSDCYSENLQNQLEFSHKYVLALYRIMDILTNKFPDILFEGCASGGNRFDLGMLCYMPQIWASDNTDAKCRIRIQNSYSYGYPQSVISAHVSQCPNHQTLRITPLETRFDVAAFGILGYECDLDDFTAYEKEQVKKQIQFYKEHRFELQFGKFYRIKDNGNFIQWLCMDKCEKGIVLFYQDSVIPGHAYDRIEFKGLNNDTEYTVTNRKVSYSIKEFGSLVNSISPIHIRMNSILQNVIDKIKHLGSEKEYIEATGDVLMKAGIKLKESFACRGYSDEIRLMKDMGTRMYEVRKKE